MKREERQIKYKALTAKLSELSGKVQRKELVTLEEISEVEAVLDEIAPHIDPTRITFLEDSFGTVEEYFRGQSSNVVVG